MHAYYTFYCCDVAVQRHRMTSIHTTFDSDDVTMQKRKKIHKNSQSNISCAHTSHTYAETELFSWILWINRYVSGKVVQSTPALNDLIILLSKDGLDFLELAAVFSGTVSLAVIERWNWRLTHHQSATDSPSIWTQEIKLEINSRRQRKMLGIWFWSFALRLIKTFLYTCCLFRLAYP